ncbi:hypothetical protein R1flu_017067 [Riccia fluitans]|uniref:Glucose-1-phosphate adenylyltransferase n=1 Tax=Riccia fluitans TaxID=41844 RepID=A0ABD1YNN4_9MARC
MAAAASNVRSAVGITQCSAPGTAAIASSVGSVLGRKAFGGEGLRSSFKKATVDFQPAEVKLKRCNSGSLVQPRASSLLAEIAKEIAQVQIPTVQAPITEFKPRVDPQTVAGLILGGGAGTRLFPLTKRRAKPAVPIGGAYRLIDVPMSNCINSGINKVFILTQFNSASLNRHLAKTYNFGNGVNFGNGFVEVLAATQTPGELGMNWFMGTADAVRQFSWVFDDVKNCGVEHVVILSGDHLYRMDYMDFVQKHADSGADITISCVPMDDSRASDYGLMKIDHRGQVLYFNEKPKGEQLRSMQVDTTVLGLSPEEARKMPYIASMGIYVFKKDILLKLLRWRYPTANDFGSEIIPASAKEFKVQAYLFNDYWEDIGTIKSFFDANLALAEQPPKFKFYDAANPIFTSPRYLPPTKVERCRVIDSIISHGCFLRECSVQHSVVGIRSRIDSGVELKDTMMMGADYYETEAEMASFLASGRVPLGVGANSKIRNCIIDKNSRIGRNVLIMNKDNVQEAERESEGFYIRSDSSDHCGILNRSWSSFAVP